MKAARDIKAGTLLVGAGHAHVGVLADWIDNGPPQGAVLLSKQPLLRYSGTLPGIISGEHDPSTGLVDLAALARRAGAKFIIDEAVGLAADDRLVTAADGSRITFEHASINIGGVGRASRVLGEAPGLFDVRPIDGFLAHYTRWRRESGAQALQICVIGGGAAGCELAFALNNAPDLPAGSKVTLVSGKSGLVPGFGYLARRLITRTLARQNIAHIKADARIEDGVLMAGEASLPFDLAVASLGSAAPQWLASTGLRLNDEGFILVDEHQRSLSHRHILACGDVARRADRAIAPSGVHAVHQGPVIAANLRSLAAGAAPQASYRPRPYSLYLLSTGRQEAIAVYGPLAFKSAALWKLKRWIDKKWLASYQTPSSSL